MKHNYDRLLLEVELEPSQGKRFQPTGFPDLGAAEIQLSTGIRSLLVESPQSMANHLEAVCLNKEKDGFDEPLQGLPLVRVMNGKKQITNSVLEGHRLCSYYIIYKGSEIRKELEKLEKTFVNGVDIKETAKMLFKLDINSLLHGIWAAQISHGRIKIPRALSAFIEADNAHDVISGGVKFDNVNPSKEKEGGSKEGQGHIIFPRVEYTSESIHAYFNLDVEQIRNYRLDENQTELLVTMAMWKIRTFLEKGLRLRTACDLKIKGDIIVTEPQGFVLPDKKSLDSEIRELITKCKNGFSGPMDIPYNKKAAK